MFYSKSTGWFYTTEIHGKNMPADVVEITEAQHEALMQAQSTGSTIGSDKKGNPIAIPPAPPTQAEINSQRKAEILAALNTVDAKSIRPIREGDTMRLADLDKQAQVLREELKLL